MKQSTSSHRLNRGRRSFLKVAAVTVFGTMAACQLSAPQEGQAPVAPPTNSPIPPEPIQPTAEDTASPLPPADTGVPSETPPPADTAVPSLPSDTPPPPDTAVPSATIAPTEATTPQGCAPDAPCDQAISSAKARISQVSRVRNYNPAHIITGLCLRDGSCVDVCPVDAIVPGKPLDEWPRFYIDPDTCIDCGACIPVCPHSAIFPEAEVPAQYVAQGGETINRAGICGHYEGTDHHGEAVVLDTVCHLTEGQVVDLTVDIQDNFDFYRTGPGYNALNP